MIKREVKATPKPPDGGWGWVVVFCSFVNQLLCVGTAMSLGIMYVFWLEEFGEDKSLTSWILSLLYFTMCIVGPLPASMAERWGFKVVTLIGGLVMSLGLAVSYFATSVGFLLVSIGCIAGSGMAFIYLSTFATVALYFDKRRTLANGIGTSGAGVGCFIMPLLMGKLEEVYGWRGAMLMLAAISLHICAAGLLLRTLEGSECIYQSGDSTRPPDIYFTDCDNQDLTGKDLSDKMALTEEMRHCGKETLGYDKIVKGSVSGKDGVDLLNERDGEESKAYDRLLIEENEMHNSCRALVVVTQVKNISGGTSRFGSAPLDVATKKDCHFSSVGDLRLRNHNISRMGSCQDHRLNSPSTDKAHRSLQRLDPYALGSMPSLLQQMFDPVPAFEDCISENSSLSTTKQTSARSSTQSKFCQNIQAYMELVQDKKLLLFATSSLLINVAVTIILVYMADRAVSEGLGTSAGALIVAFNGIGNVIGRVFFGFAADHFFRDHITCYVLIMTIMGIATLFSPFCGHYIELHCLFTTIFGATLGGNVVLMVSVIVTLMGLERTTLALGLNLVAIGIGDLIGPPVGGWLYDVTQTYLYSFLLAGTLALISALLLIPLRKK